MSRDEISVAVDWAAAEGWNPGLDDAACFHAADPDGFLVGTLDGEPVATISAVRYGASFGFIGFYIVQPGQRGNGYGLRIWNAAMRRLDRRNIGLDGVVAQQDNYRKSGFALAWRNVRYEGVCGGAAADDCAIVPLATVAFSDIERYDRAFFPAERDAFLKAWVGQPRATAIGLVERGTLRGVAVMRRCRSGCKIGPLFADGPEIADRLFVRCRATAPQGAPVFIDIPQTNPHALELVERHGMRPMFETARMYTRAVPPLPAARMFGITSFELG